MADLLGVWYYLQAHPTLSYADVSGDWPIPPWWRAWEGRLSLLAAEGRKQRAAWAALKDRTADA